jgi:hypothetical protein
MRTVSATRYVTPLREGGSLPAIIEADDEGMYVLKFRGAGQGPKALVAELVAGEIARALGLPVPEIVLVELAAVLALTEPDSEIQDLMRASVGLNAGLDYLPRSVAFDPVVDQPAAELASSIVWFDALVSNVDRSARNTNMLVWHRRLHLIDHGAALYFHHDWVSASEHALSRFPMIRDHVLLPFASHLRDVDAVLSSRLDPALFATILDLVPDAWLLDPFFAGPNENRAAYVDYLSRRLLGRDAFVEEAIHAHAACL